MVDRYIKEQIQALLKPKKVNVLLGARRVGKTYIMQEIAKEYSSEVLWLDGDLATTKELLEHKNLDRYKQLIGDAKLLIIDEAQEIKEIGSVLKIMVDHIPEVAYMASGSSPFDLANKTGEPLVGRAHWHYLYPLAQIEINRHESLIATTERLSERLIYGSYPEVYTTDGYDLKRRYLNELTNSYLLKDIINYSGIRNSRKILDLLKLIAWQIGQEVSIQELGWKEVTKNSRFYFWDNGIRNAIINDFRPLDQRSDIGDLWENYLFIERLKKLTYQKIRSQLYFWRTYDQQEIDCIESLHDDLVGYEYKWSNNSVKPPRAFTTAYPHAHFETINRSNYLSYIS